MSRILYLFFVFFLVVMLFLFPWLPCPLCVGKAHAATSLTLAWDPNTEPDLAGYKLYYGKAIGTYESVIDVGNQTTYNISDLEEGKTYFFAVTAYNSNGLASDFSSELRYPEPFSVTISLSAGLNLISLSLEPLNPSISALTEKLSPCLLQVSAYMKDIEGNDIWLHYDPSQLDQSTLTAMEPGKGYWIDMGCLGEITVVGNRTRNPITLFPGLNLVGYNSLTPLPISQALSSIANKYTTVWAYKEDQWLFYDPADVAGSTLQVLTPGSGYWIEATEETIWTLPLATTISLSAGLNLISLPLEPLNPSISALTEKLSPCLRQVLAYTRDAEGNDSRLFYDPSQLDQSTLSSMEPGKGYWVEMTCPGEMTIVGNRTTNSISLTVGENIVGYNSLTPLPISTALAGIANKYTSVRAYEGDQWIFYDPSDETGSTLKVLRPGSGYFIEEVTEETPWTLPNMGY